MKYSVYPTTTLKAIPTNANKLHLVRPLKLKKLSEFLQKRKIKEISMSQSCLKRLSEKSKKLFQEKNITIKTDNRSGRILEIPIQEIVKINDYRKDYQSLRKIQKLTGIPKSTIHYLERYAKRNKIRKSNQTIYLE